MKHLLFWLFIGCSSLVAEVVQAQTCPVTPNAPACTFEVTDARTGTIVDRLCVGRAVRFTPCSSRDLSLVYTYQVTQGNAVLPNPCGPGFVAASTTYTPTQAGFITVTENSQAVGGSTSTIYYQVFQVVDSPVPNFTVAACAPGSVQVTLPDTPYDTYDVQIGSGTPVTAAPGAVVSYPVPAGANTITVTGRYADNRLCTNAATKPILQLAAPSALVIRTITLQGTSALLDVAPLATGYRYFVEREDGSGVYQPLPATVQNSPTSFTVPNAQPGRYRLRTADACTEQVSTSTPVSTLTLTAAPAERRNELNWQLLDNPTAYELTRNGTPLVVPLQPSARAYSDTSVTCGVQYTYRLTARYSGTSASVSNEVQVRATATQPPLPHAYLRHLTCATESS
ncbi:hypothetical protein [Hymenobacter volaticus]|uniref:Fibronectin type-III domain-containing protein n=1 Tax=Hymenobacter volaticus TaxID=2932254 RepID=A0ABY4GB71_9BACT|nr:hypothetical protein [Hymenobacter volaticus]UOQ68011.1 hypothetical protein MUN86_09225 [Hymenobacter volaticus]